MFDELPLDDERLEPRKGSNAWVAAELKRFRDLCKEHEGLTSPFFAKIALGVSKQRVHELMKNGKLPSFEILGKTFIACDVLESFCKVERHDRGGRPRKIVEVAA
jgi:hypothetical protein